MSQIFDDLLLFDHEVHVDITGVFTLLNRGLPHPLDQLEFTLPDQVDVRCLLTFFHQHFVLMNDNGNNVEKMLRYLSARPLPVERRAAEPLDLLLRLFVFNLV